MNIKEGIWHLLKAIPNIDKSAEYFREYLNSGSKECWDQYVTASLFGINLCQICVYKLLKENDCKLVEFCENIFYDKSFKYSDYTPDNREGQEKVLEILWRIRIIIYPLTIKILKENNIKCSEILSPEYDSLLKNSKSQV